jgi:hypothetical protein
MSLQIAGSSGIGAEVDSTLKAFRVTNRPLECLNTISVGAQTGNLTTIAAAAPLFAFRNLSVNPIVIKRIGIGVFCGTVFTVAQKIDYALFVARNWTVSDSGGTAIALTGNNAKHRVTHATPTSVDMRIASTAALTAGTRTLDTNSLSQIQGIGSAAIGVGVPSGLNNLFSHDAEDYPLIIAQNEGIAITNQTLMGAGGIITLAVNIEFSEVTSY